MLNCPPAADPNACGFGPGVTLIEGPSTLLLTLADSTASESIGCALTGTTAAVCTVSVGGSAVGSVGEISTTTLGPTDMTYFPVVVTAGQALLASAPGATTAAATAAMTSTDSNTLFTIVGGATSTLEGSATANTGGASQETTGAGMPKSTGAAASADSVAGLVVAVVLLGIAAV